MTPFHIPDSRVVKVTAKTALEGRKTEATVASLLSLFALMLMNVLSSIIVINSEKIADIIAIVVNIAFSILIIAPLLLGTVRFFWRMTDGAKDEFSGVLYYFSDKAKYIKALKLTFIVGFRIATSLFICLLPYAIVSLISGGQLYQLLGYDIPLWAPNLILIQSFLYILGVTATVFYISRYYLVPVLVVMDEELLLLEAVHISCMVSKKSLGSFMSLLTSLIIWIVLTLFLIPAVYTLPFILACYVIHCRFAITNYNLVVDYYENNLSGYYDEKE